MRKIFCLITLFFIGFATKAQNLSKYDKGSFIKGKDSIYYRILFPENFDAKQKYPILFFLHGVGERGSDNTKQLLNGGKFFLNDDFRKNFPAIIVFPQCPLTSFWPNANFSLDEKGKRKIAFIEGGKPTVIMHALQGMVKDFLKKPFVDKNQVYIGGLSLGAMGTYELLRRKPNIFAAAFAICGGDNTNNVEKYKKVPMWIFHGAKDDVVDPAFSIAITERLKTLGDEVKFSLYPEAKHNSWDNAFAEKGLMPWLFSHKKKQNTPL